MTTIDNVLHDFGTADNTLPRRSMAWALAHWEQVYLPFTRVLDEFVNGEDRSEEAASELFFILHLMGAHGETRAFPAICRLLRDYDATEEVIGDSVTETLPGILIGSFDGDPAPLRSVIEDPAADDFVREATLLVMAYLTRTGCVAETEMRLYLQRLLGELDPEVDAILLMGCVLSVAFLGYEDMAGPVETVLTTPAMREEHLLDMANFRRTLAETLADPTGMAGFTSEGIAPFGDIIAELATWDSFNPDRQNDDDRFATPINSNALAPLEPVVPYINLLRHVGRNDPCPCGSGKKFKHCCGRGV